jgi:hypothetical protein
MSAPAALGFISLCALGKHSHTLGLAGAVRQNDSATNHLVRLLGVDAKLHGHVDRFVELGGGAFLDDAQGISQWIQLVAVDLARKGLLFLGELRHVKHPPHSHPSNGQNRRWYGQQRQDRQLSGLSFSPWQFLQVGRG